VRSSSATEDSLTPDRPLRDDGTAVAITRRGANRRLILVLRILTFAIVMLGWEGAVRLGYADPFFFSKPSDIFIRMVDWIINGTIWRHLATTLIEALLAFVIGTAFGVLLGLALARVELLSAVLDPYIRILNALPRVILAPIFLLWFGLGIASKVAFAVSLVFFVVFFNTFQGVREVDPTFVNNARMLQASDRHLLRYVYLPSAMSWIFSSLHTSIGFALVGAVIGEYLGSAQGMGYLVAQSEGVFDTTGVLAGVILTSVIVLLIDLAINRLETYLLRWRPRV
jgi:NitT/TauT family transport system permease protein